MKRVNLLNDANRQVSLRINPVGHGFEARAPGQLNGLVTVDVGVTPRELELPLLERLTELRRGAARDGGRGGRRGRSSGARVGDRPRALGLIPIGLPPVLDAIDPVGAAPAGGIAGAVAGLRVEGAGPRVDQARHGAVVCHVTRLPDYVVGRVAEGRLALHRRVAPRPPFCPAAGAAADAAWGGAAVQGNPRASGESQN